MNIKDFFDNNYKKCEYYWWKNDNRFSTDETEHTPYYSMILRSAKDIGTGRALDIGAGEGADSIRLAKLGFIVDSVEISDVAVEKIELLAEANNVTINVSCSDITSYNFEYDYDIIMINGVLHYLDEVSKIDILTKVVSHTKIGGICCISLFSTASPVPECHKVVSVYPDNENGLVESFFSDWTMLFKSYERNKQETSHTEMTPHVHSFIKFIARRAK